jgi:hypothetical protein
MNEIVRLVVLTKLMEQNSSCHDRFVWDKWYTQVDGTPTRGDSLMDVYLSRPESSLISCDTVQGISDHCGVLLDVEWSEKGFVTHEKRLVPAYHKTNVLGLQQFLRDKLPTWANNGSWEEDIWKHFKDIVFEGIERFVPQKILKRNPDPEYYNKEVKRLKVKVRRAHNRRKLGENYQAELKRLYKKLLTAK